MIFVKQVFEQVDLFILAADFNNDFFYDISKPIAVLFRFIDFIATDDIVNVVIGPVLTDADIFDRSFEVFACLIVFEVDGTIDLKLRFLQNKVVAHVSVPHFFQIAMKYVSSTPDNNFVFGDSKTLCVFETFDYIFDIHLFFGTRFAC